MSDLDDKIKDALSAEQDELYNEEDDWNSHLESLKTMFRGSLKWLTIFHFSTMAVLVTMIIVSAVQFFRVESTRAMIAWATGFAVFTIVEAIVELLFLMEWDKYVIRREVKQLELQIVSLTNEIRDAGLTKTASSATESE